MSNCCIELAKINRYSDSKGGSTGERSRAAGSCDMLSLKYSTTVKRHWCDMVKCTAVTYVVMTVMRV